ncbi:distal tail protein Dit [Streptomyces sp. NPDC001658]
MAQQALGRIQWGNLVFGPGSPYAVSAIDGVDDLPEIRSEDVPRPGQHGDYTGPDFTGPRVIPVKLGLRADSPDQLRELSLALRNATQVQRQPEPLRFLDQDVLVWAKVRKRNIPYDAEYLWRIGDAALEFYCADPYLYSLAEHSASTTAYSPAAGRQYPLAYNGAGVEVRNLALNPSAEVDLTNTVTLGANVTRTRVTTDAKVGVASVEHTHTSGTASQAGSLWLIPTVTEGATLRLSFWVKVVSGAPASGYVGLRLAAGTPLQLPLPALPPAGTWGRIDVAYTLGAGESYDRFGLALNGSTGTVWRADAVMADPSGQLHEYVDGSLSGCVWDGTAHASTSRRAVSWPRSYGDAGESGRLTAVNNGASPAYPVLRLDGPVANPAIEQTNTGAVLTLDATLQPGEYLLIDTRSRAVLLMGSSPRRSWVRGGSTWPLLLPGSNELAYRGSALPGAPGQSSLLTVTWRDTSL